MFFDAIKARWTYEPEGYELPGLGRYLPDFWLRMRPGFSEYRNAGMFVEIKGCQPTDKECQKVVTLARLTKHNTAIFVGVPGEQEVFVAHNKLGGRWESHDSPVGWADRHSWPLTVLAHQYEGECACDVEEAITRARSARFEHGEMG